MQLQSEKAVVDSGISRYRNSFHCAQDVVKKEGFKGLYRGLSASLLGLTESTLQFVMYESFKSSILEYKRKTESNPQISLYIT
jgi:solute carrier family 25, member 33/36